MAPSRFPLLVDVGAGSHDLRRAYATGLVAEGMDIKKAQKRLRHGDPRMPLGLYASAGAGVERRAADLMGGAVPRQAESSQRQEPECAMNVR